MRTIPGMDAYLMRIDDVISNTLLPSIFDAIITEEDRRLFSLPTRLGGLSIPILSEIASNHFEASKIVTAPLVTVMVNQTDQLPNAADVKKAKSKVSSELNSIYERKSKEIDDSLPPNVLRSVIEAREKGASSWLSVLPLSEFGFDLNKGEFRDAVNLRYNKPLRGLQSKCPYGENFNVNHALNCKRGGFVIMRHNNIRDYEAELLKQTQTDVEIEPPLQPINGKQILGLSGDEVRPDIYARGVW